MGKAILSKNDARVMKADNVIGLPASAVSKYLGEAENIFFPNSVQSAATANQQAAASASSKSMWIWILVIAAVIILLYLVYTKKIKL